MLNLLLVPPIKRNHSIINMSFIVKLFDDFFYLFTHGLPDQLIDQVCPYLYFVEIEI